MHNDGLPRLCSPIQEQILRNSPVGPPVHRYLYQKKQGSTRTPSTTDHAILPRNRPNMEPKRRAVQLLHGLRLRPWKPTKPRARERPRRTNPRDRPCARTARRPRSRPKQRPDQTSPEFKNLSQRYEPRSAYRARLFSTPTGHHGPIRHLPDGGITHVKGHQRPAVPRNPPAAYSRTHMGITHRLNRLPVLYPPTLLNRLTKCQPDPSTWCFPEYCCCSQQQSRQE